MDSLSRRIAEVIVVKAHQLSTNNNFIGGNLSMDIYPGTFDHIVYIQIQQESYVAYFSAHNNKFLAVKELKNGKIIDFNLIADNVKFL